MSVQSISSNAVCRNCGSRDLTWITKNISILVPTLYPLSGDFSVICCESCQFVGNYSVSGKADYINYYTNYNKHYHRNGSLSIIDEAYFMGVLDLIEKDGQLRWDDTDVLDFGSGALAFSNLAAKRGARACYNYDMESPYEDIEYGLIASTHCFEHIFDFIFEFSRINSILRENGLFCVAVPDLRGYFDFYYGPYNCFDLEHINHFEIDTLTDSLTRTGFEIVSVRESERRVTPTLAYPEILVLARKTGNLSKSLESQISIRESPRLVLEKYLDKSENDLNLILPFILDNISRILSVSPAISCGFYGLSSYAFRVLRVLNDSDFKGLAWMADSDERLRGKTISDFIIKDSNEFATLVDENLKSNIRTVAFVCAVNSDRIVSYLTERYSDAIDVIAIPPDCQNKRS